MGVCVSWRRKAPFRETLLLVPPVLRLGLGCRRGIAAEAVRAVVEQVLDQHGIHPRAVKGAASIDLKRDEAGLLDCCAAQGWPLDFYSAGELAALEGTSPRRSGCCGSPGWTTCASGPPPWAGGV